MNSFSTILTPFKHRSGHVISYTLSPLEKEEEIVYKKNRVLFLQPIPRKHFNLAHRCEVEVMNNGQLQCVKADKLRPNQIWMEFAPSDGEYVSICDTAPNMVLYGKPGLLQLFYDCTVTRNPELPGYQVIGHMMWEIRDPLVSNGPEIKHLSRAFLDRFLNQANKIALHCSFGETLEVLSRAKYIKNKRKIKAESK